MIFAYLFAGYPRHVPGFGPLLWLSQEQGYNKSHWVTFFKGAQIHMVCAAWICHGSDNCFGSWCLDSLTSTCTPLSGNSVFSIFCHCISYIVIYTSLFQLIIYSAIFVITFNCHILFILWEKLFIEQINESSHSYCLIYITLIFNYLFLFPFYKNTSNLTDFSLYVHTEILCYSWVHYFVGINNSKFWIFVVWDLEIHSSAHYLCQAISSVSSPLFC
jgi:hypothetical protein